MNSKQRVMTSVGHGEPDRVPLAYGATPEVTKRLEGYLGVANEEELLDALSVDFRQVQPVTRMHAYGDFFGDPLIEDLGGGRFKDIWGATFRRVHYGLGTYVEVESNPLADIVDTSELDRYPWPCVRDVWDFGNIKSDARERGDYAIVYDGAVLFQFCQALRGIERLLTDIHTGPLIAQAILQKVANYWIDFGVALLEAAEGAIDFFVINDDYGTQQGPLFNPATWRKYLKPIIREVIEVYKRFGVKIIFHSCGSVRPFIPDLVEMGVDVLDPVQVSARDMVPRSLKDEFGTRLCFRGAIDTQRVMPKGTPEEVREEVRRRMRELAPRGGYIATSVHNIQPDVPLANIIAMYEAAWEFGRYPIL